MLICHAQIHVVMSIIGHYETNIKANYQFENVKGTLVEHQPYVRLVKGGIGSG